MPSSRGAGGVELYGQCQWPKPARISIDTLHLWLGWWPRRPAAVPMGMLVRAHCPPPGKGTPRAGRSPSLACCLPCLVPSCVSLALSSENSPLASVCPRPRDTPRAHCLCEGFFQAASSMASCCMTPCPHPRATALIFTAFVEKSTHSFAKLFLSTPCNVLGTSCSISGEWTDQCASVGARGCASVCASV